MGRSAVVSQVSRLLDTGARLERRSQVQADIAPWAAALAPMVADSGIVGTSNCKVTGLVAATSCCPDPMTLRGRQTRAAPRPGYLKARF